MSFIGKYELLDELGTGSMGTVYRALDTLLEREVALKTLRKVPGMQPDMTERFYREAKACAKLHHSSIVTIYDLGEADGTIFIAMELLKGENLRRVIAAKEPLATGLKLELMAQICEGLGHAHRAGIIHRDIKPSNIFKTESNAAKVLDFGIAKIPASLLTVAGNVLGTPNYMSPEQILGKPFDGRSDLFSAAVVLFELLTGVHPFQANSIPRRIVSEPAERLRAIEPSLPASLDEKLAKALASDPQMRYQSADEFAAQIRESIRDVENMPILSAAPTTALPDSAPPEPVAPSAGMETSEWRISEFLRLLQEFDDALESDNSEGARRFLEQMRALEAADNRFTVAVLEYESRLQAIEKPATENPIQAADKGVPPEPKPAVATAGPMPAEGHSAGPVIPSPPVPQSSSSWDATRLFSTPAAVVANSESTELPRPKSSEFWDSKPLPPVDPNADRPFRTQDSSSRYYASSAAPALFPQNPLQNPVQNPAERSHGLFDALPFKLGKRDNRSWVALPIAAAIVLVVTSVYAILSSEKGNAALKSSLGTAQVRVSKSLIYPGPVASGTPIHTLHRSDTVNVLPASAYAPDWLHVQYVRGADGGTPGYMKSSDLTNWSSLKALRTLQPADGASTAQRLMYIRQAKDYLEQHGTDADANDARRDIATQDIALAKAAKNRGDPSSEIDADAQDASQALDSMSLGAGSLPDVQRQRREIASLQQAVVVSPGSSQLPGQLPSSQPDGNPSASPVTKGDPAAVVVPPVAIDPAVDYRRAIHAWQSGDYARAKRALDRILRKQPNNADAKALLDKVVRAQAIDPGVSQ